MPPPAECRQSEVRENRTADSRYALSHDLILSAPASGLSRTTGNYGCFAASFTDGLECLDDQGGPVAMTLVLREDPGVRDGVLAVVLAVVEIADELAVHRDLEA